MDAIEMKQKDPSVILNKYNDPIEEAEEDISLEKAEEVAREDANLIWTTI